MRRLVLDLEISEGIPRYFPHLPESPRPVAGQEVDVCPEQRLGRDFQASCPQLGEVKVPHLITGLSGRGVAGGMEGLFASFAAFPRLALLLLPVFLRARPGLVRVVFLCALVLRTWAGAQLLPDRQGYGHLAGESARGVVRSGYAIAVVSGGSQYLVRLVRGELETQGLITLAPPAARASQ
jgi:hypothetical protein